MRGGGRGTNIVKAQNQKSICVAGVGGRGISDCQSKTLFASQIANVRNFRPSREPGKKIVSVPPPQATEHSWQDAGVLLVVFCVCLQLYMLQCLMNS
jgi:hypothetical protein